MVEFGASARPGNDQSSLRVGQDVAKFDLAVLGIDQHDRPTCQVRPQISHHKFGTVFEKKSHFVARRETPFFKTGGEPGNVPV